ncbi:MAG: MaoC family dehydratase [SAR324 cluster bacterium]|nr:MaoC family dehydratase [SAR324 cluster bacterium]
MGKYNLENFFEDFEVGSTIKHLFSRTLTEGDNALYVALTGDRFPLYCSAEFAQKLGFRRELINDLLVFHTIFGKSVPDISSNAIANLGYADVRFLQPVYPGDTLSAESEIIGKKEPPGGQAGQVYVHTKGMNQHGKIVLQFYRWIKINKRFPEETTEPQGNVTPPPEIDLRHVQIPSALTQETIDPSITRGRWFFDDYTIGERIHHLDGRTIEESDHMMAANAYQNTAKVHFNGHQMANSRFGKRLIYGGYVISIARSLSFNGLENTLGILGWNSGTHINPTFGGDTLYAWSEVLDKINLPGIDHFGALRIGLATVKNLSLQKEQWQEIELKFVDPETEKEQYHPNAVLYLDYYILMPKK